MLKISGIVQSATVQGGQDPHIKDAIVTLHVGEREICQVRTDRLGRFEYYEEQSSYKGVPLTCRVTSPQFQAYENKITIDKDAFEFTYDIKLQRPPGGEGSDPWWKQPGVLIVGACIFLLLCIAIYQIFYSVDSPKTPPQWSSLGEKTSDGKARQATLIVDDGVPYVGFQDVKHGSKGTVMDFRGEAWASVGTSGFSDGELIEMALVVEDEIPVVAYRGSEKHAFRAIVRTYDKATKQWKFVGNNPVSEGSVSQFISLSAHDDDLYLFFNQIGGKAGAYVKKWDGTNWTDVGPNPIASGNIRYSKMVVEDSRIYVAYSKGSNPTLSILQFVKDTWDPVKPTPIPITLGSPIFAFGVDEKRPHIAYSDKDEKLSVFFLDHGGIHPIMGTTTISKGKVSYLSLVVEKEKLYVAFKDRGENGKSVVKMYNGEEWEMLGTPFSSKTSSGLSLFVEKKIPYIAYQDEAKGGKLTVMKFD